MSKSMAVLERRPVTLLDPVKDEVDPQIAELGARAEQVLGYGVLMDAVNRERAVAARARQPLNLAQALHDLDIQPFSDRSVEKYKARRLEEKIGFLGPRHMLRGVVFCFSWAFALSCFVAFLWKIPPPGNPAETTVWFFSRGMYYMIGIVVFSIVTAY